MIVDVERIEKAVGSVEQHTDAQLLALGFHEPKKLWQSRRQALMALMRGPQAPTPEEAVLAQVARIEAVVEAHRLKTTPTPES
jgi:hypothetical protein